MFDQSTDNYLERFINVLRAAINDAETCIRIVKKSLISLEMTQRTDEKNTFNNEIKSVAELFNDFTYGGKTKVRIDSTGINVRRLFRFEESDLRRIVDVKDFKRIKSFFCKMFEKKTREVRVNARHKKIV